MVDSILGALGAPWGALLGDLGHLRAIIFAIIELLFKRFLPDYFFVLILILKSSKKVFFGGTEMWLLYSK